MDTSPFERWQDCGIWSGLDFESGRGTSEHRPLGRNPGFIAGMCRFLDDGLTVIVLCNRWKADVWPLVSQIGSLHLPGVAADALPRLF